MKVTNATEIRYGAYGVILVESKLLLTQKKSGPFKGLWGLPGGAIEFGETPEVTLKRELIEETAYAVTGLELLSVTSCVGQHSRDGQDYTFHHVGIIYRVNNISLVQGFVPEEEMRWIAEHEFNLEELTPFAKQVHSERLIVW